MTNDEIRNKPEARSPEARVPAGCFGFRISDFFRHLDFGFRHCHRSHSPITKSSEPRIAVMSQLLPGHMMSDITAILGSLDFVMGECDR